MDKIQIENRIEEIKTEPQLQQSGQLIAEELKKLIDDLFIRIEILEAKIK